MKEAPLPKELTTGVWEIDVDHGFQLAMVEEFKAAQAAGRGGEELAAILQRLEDYTNAHFLGEMLLMRQRAYPDHEVHEQEHDRLLEALDVLRQQCQRGEIVPLAGQMLHQWFSQHILTLDQALAAFLHGHGHPGDEV
jgi:hemerythrin-like metal-binding protein